LVPTKTSTPLFPGRGTSCGIAVHEKSDVVPLATNTTNRRVEVGACWPALSCPSGPALPGQ